MKSAVNIIAALVSGAAFGVAVASCVKAPVPNGRAALVEELAARDSEIRTWRVDAGLTVEPPPPMIPEFRDKSIPYIKRICPGDVVPPPSCDEICNLADAICDNAEDICIIAGKLGNDVWSKGKCDSAKASCSEAKQRCCDCKDKETDRANALSPPAADPSPSPPPTP